MRDDEFQQAMDAWVESEIESAPDLRPTAEMIRLVQAKQAPRRAFSLSSRWVVAGAAAAGLVLVVVLFALILRSSVIPGWPPTPEVMLIAQRAGPAGVQTAVVKGGEKGPGEKGSMRGQAAFLRLVFEIQRPDDPIVQAVDLLNPPRETISLTPDDNYRLALELVEARHVHVYQLTSSGNLVRLFPNPAYSPAENPLLPGLATLLPAGPNWLYLDGVPGEERLYVVASTGPLQNLDDLYARHTQEPDAAARDETLSELLAKLETAASVVEFAFQHR